MLKVFLVFFGAVLQGRGLVGRQAGNGDEQKGVLSTFVFARLVSLQSYVNFAGLYAR